MQLLGEVSEEFGLHEGLGLVPGRVVKLEASNLGERVPNIGWCDVSIPPNSRLFSGIKDGSSFYSREPHQAPVSDCCDRINREEF